MTPATEVTARIERSTTEVWDVLTRVEAMPQWTASITAVELLDGDVALRAGGRVRIRQPGLGTAVWTVDSLMPPRRFSWSDVRTGVTTRADHIVVPVTSDSSTREASSVTLRVSHEGVLAFLATALLHRKVQRLMEMELAGLKARCESNRRDDDQ